MNLLYKQLIKEIFKNKIFAILMFILTFCTSFIYFFVHFSIDGNMNILNSLSSLSEHQLLYKNALSSNTILARNILVVFIALTSFVFCMFFYRFFKQNSKEIGCLKSLGFKDSDLCNCFVAFSALISILGGILGLGLGYLVSDVLLQAGSISYQVTNLVKTINVSSAIIGILLPTAILCFITFLSYFFIKGKDMAFLISPITDNASYNALLRTANKLADICPTENKFSIRIALRKPITLLLMLIAVISFSVMFILAYSLNLSSQKVYDSQTLGHNYLFEAHFDAPKYLETSMPNTMPYLDAPVKLEFSNSTIEQQVIGIKNNSSLFEFIDDKGNIIPAPASGEVIINPALRDIYGLKQGDTVTLWTGNRSEIFTISYIAFNAKLNSVYIAPSDLESLLGLHSNSYTGILSMENNFYAFSVITREQKIADLERDFVSNRISAVINQVIGCLMGCILIFLALLLNFQDNTRDIFILSLMGYRPNVIRSKLVDIYRPIIWIFFLLTLWPSIEIVKNILKSLSIQIGDYMPFQTNIFVIAGIFVLLNIIYFLVQFTFNLGINNIIKSDKLYEYTNND